MRSVCLLVLLAGCGASRAAVERPRTSPAELGYVAVAPDVLSREVEVAGYPTLDLIIGLDEGEGIPETLPLVIALHGRGDGPEVPTRVYRSLHQPYRFVMPRGPLEVESGYAWFSVRTVDAQEALLAEEIVTQAAAVAQIIEALRSSDPRPSRVIVAGFSQGGILTYALVARHGALFDAAFPMAGWLPTSLVPEAAPPDAPPTFALHGEDDEWVAASLAEQTVAALGAAGFDVELRMFPGVTHVLSDEEAAVLTGWLDQALAPAD